MRSLNHPANFLSGGAGGARRFCAAALLLAAVPSFAFAQLIRHYSTCPVLDPTDLAIADFDGDGDNDIVATTEFFCSGNNYPGGAMLFFANARNAGPAIFKPPIVSSTGSQANARCWKLDAGDLNGDGLPDVALAQTFIWGLINTSRVVVKLNVGGGLFAPPANFTPAPPGYATLDVAIVDIDRDGDNDIVSINNPSFIVGPFPTTLPALVSVLLNNGSGTFTFGGLFSLGAVDSLNIIAGDVDNDGDPDLVVAHQPRSSGPFNGGGVAVFHNTSTGAGNFGFGTPNPYATGLFPRVARLADLNNDGWLDMVTTNILFFPLTSGIVVHLNTQNTANLFPPTAVYITSTQYWTTDVCAADIDLDGDLDLLTADQLTSGYTGFEGSVSLFFNDGTGVNYNVGLPAAPFLNAMGMNPSACAAGDLDGQGGPDLVVTNVFAAHISVILNRPPCPADLDGDLDVDGADAVILNGFIANSACVTTGFPTLYPPCAGDLDGDGSVTVLDALVQAGLVGLCP